MEKARIKQIKMPLHFMYRILSFIFGQNLQQAAI